MAVDFKDDRASYLAGVKRPAFLYDKSNGIRHKFGEFEYVELVYRTWREAYIAAGFEYLANDLAIVEVEPNQELIDELFQSSGKFALFVKELNLTDGTVH